MYKNVDSQVYMGNYDDETISYYEQQLTSPNDSENIDVYIDTKSKLDTMKLMQKYGFNSWQAYIIETNLESTRDIHVINEYTYAPRKTVSEKEYHTAKQNYDNFIQKLDAGDWKYFVNIDLNAINQEIESIKNDITNSDNNLHSLETQKQALKWRLEKDISYEESFLNTCIRRYINNSEIVYSYEQTSKHEYSEKQEYYSALEAMNTCKYYIENNIRNINSNDNRAILLDLLDSYELFILIFIIMIAGSIVSDEFSKGTIKLLLVRPYSRIKILFSKFIVCIMILLLFIAFVACSQFIFGGLIQGFESTSTPAIVYNHNTNQVETIGIIPHIALTTIAKLPIYILLMTLAFACSTIFTNTAVSIVIPLLGYMGSSLINQLGLIYDIKAVLYFVTPNWDLTERLFGGLPTFEGLTIPFSLAICLIYFLIMFVTMFTVFKKRNIKNI